MQRKNERLEYRMQHLIQAVKDSDAALADALTADVDQRKQLHTKYAYLSQTPNHQAPAKA